jgi:hypothetical protein
LAPDGTRLVNATISTPRRRQIEPNKHIATDLLTSSMAEIDIDTRADTICAGKASCVIEYTDPVCDVSPFTSEYEPMRNIPVAKMATAYDLYDHETYILVTVQSLYFGDKLENTLLCPNQMWSHGIEVDDVPRHLSIDGKSSHSIYIPAEDVRLDCYYMVVFHTYPQDIQQIMSWRTANG